MNLLHEPAQPDTLADGRLRRVPILIFNIHSHCNCRCLMCDIWKRTQHEQIDTTDLEGHRHSLQALGVRQVVFSGGEPLLHTDLDSLCRFFREMGIRLTLLTTGLLLHKRAGEVAEYFDEIIVSLDGPNDVHDNIRRVKGAFAVIVKGIAAVRAICPGMRITCRTTVQKANHDQLCATARTAREAGFNGISFLAADLTSEAFNRALVWPGERQNEIALTQAELGVLETEMDALSALNKELGTAFVAESRRKLERIITHFRVHLGLAMPAAPICNAPWVSAVIEADGSLRPCFFHPSVGNLHSSTLDEIINGEGGRRFRQALDVENNSICRKCVCSLNHPMSEDLKNPGTPRDK
jgi:Fe-coproporphyrin III synthase